MADQKTVPEENNRSPSFSQEFLAFVQRYQVLGLAIGIVIGAATNNVVTALVDGIINPFIGLFLPAGSLTETVLLFGKSEFRIGAVVSSLINFLIIALLIFVVVQKFLKIEVKK